MARNFVAIAFMNFGYTSNKSNAMFCETYEGGGECPCCELYHGTLDVCKVNKVRKYHSMCKMVDSVYVAIEIQQRVFC